MSEELRENATDPSDELIELTVRHLDGRLTDAQRQRLNLLLTADPDSRDAFVAVCTHACLLASHVGIADDDCATRRSDGESPEPAQASMGEAVPAPGLSFPPYLMHAVPIAYAIATVLLALGLLALSRLPGGDRTPASAPVAMADGVGSRIGSKAARLPAAVYAAAITALQDCRWTDPDNAAKQIAAGRIAIQSGRVEVTYPSGARIVLQGPAVYMASGRNGGLLAIGNLTAFGERRTSRARQAGGGASATSDEPLLSIRTPTTIVTDQGAVFAVAVDKAGTSSVRVLHGQVFLLSPDTRCKDVTYLGENDFAWTEIRDGRELVEHSWTWKHRPPPELASPALKGSPVYTLETRSRGRADEKPGQNNSPRS